MNLSDIKIEVKRLTGRNDSSFDPRITAAVNRAIRAWARGQPWPALKRTMDIVHPGGRTMYFPSEVERVVWLLDKTNQRSVDAANDQWDRADSYEYANDYQGYAETWKPAGISPIFTSVSGPLVMNSNNASDAISVYVTGLIQPGAGPITNYETGEAINIVGASPITMINSFFRVNSICKSADTLGMITVRALGNPVAYIGPYDREARYPMVDFMDIPADGTTFRCGLYTRPPTLVNAYQSPPPSVDSDFLIWMAASDVHYQLGEGERSTAARAKALEIVKDDISVDKMFGDWNGQIIPETP